MRGAPGAAVTMELPGGERDRARRRTWVKGCSHSVRALLDPGFVVEAGGRTRPERGATGPRPDATAAEPSWEDQRVDTPDAFPEPLPGTDGTDGAVGRDASADDGPSEDRRLVRCRPLTGTDSRRAGLGPSCDAKLHPAPPDIRTRRHEVDQDPLPGA